MNAPIPPDALLKIGVVEKGQRRNARHEANMQEGVIKWVNHQKNAWPELKTLHAGAEGGKREKFTAWALERMGILAGLPDLRWPLPRIINGWYCNMLWIELKWKDNEENEAQQQMFPRLGRWGLVITLRDAEIITRAIKWYYRQPAPPERPGPIVIPGVGIVQ